MDFKKVKPLLKKPVLWTGSIIFGLIMISLIIILTLPLEKNQKIIISCQITLNFLLVYLIACILGNKRSSISLFTDILVFEDEQKQESIEVKPSRYLHIFINIFTIACFFIHLTSGSMIGEISFAQYAAQKWWLFLIVYLINTIFLYLYFYILIYLLNESKEFKDEYLTNLKNNKQTIENKEKVVE
ncbi:hypothetical protein [Spiroplasma culicicola]|uniref:Transmembrane protein n=1 Tax=Spiroplasma culicicola AES-1 TaxID=1276246 RepID=W6A615_9MOLU|nr:hypothetical protein [Spiroplasma culicicola]AHI52437.1 hypothetical protein SCULI_v1c00960 [Spiroplasma culicicola AES-1]